MDTAAVAWAFEKVGETRCGVIKNGFLVNLFLTRSKK
jgi:hypothetical protein